MKENYINCPFEMKAGALKENGSFSGYGSLFDKKEDLHGDIISPGAFTKTLEAGGRNKTGIAMLWQHDSDTIPGVWRNLEENKKGLKVDGQLAIRTDLGKNVYEILKLCSELGTFKMGLSIGFNSIKYRIDNEKDIRYLDEISLWEISIVTFPAKLGADISNVKKTDEQNNFKFKNDLLNDNIRQIEDILKHIENKKNNSKNRYQTILNDLKKTNVELRGYYGRNN